MTDIKKELLETAGNIVNGARRKAYGTPEMNFERIARFWQAYFENTDRGNVKITAADVSPLMRLMKEARLCETPDHKDSFVDIIGYTLTGAEVNQVEPKEDATEAYKKSMLQQGCVRAGPPTPRSEVIQNSPVVPQVLPLFQEEFSADNGELPKAHYEGDFGTLRQQLDRYEYPRDVIDM